MKKYFYLIIGLLLVGSCAHESNNSLSNSSYESNSSINNSTTEENSSLSLPLKTSSSVEEESSTTSNNLQEKLPIPENKDYKIVLTSQKVTSFKFENSTMPQYFRGIYGNNFHEDYYASGTLKIDSDNEAKKGFQTAMFVTEKKLEVRLKIGEMHGKNKSKFDKNKPVLIVDGYSENGTKITTYNIENDKFTSNKGNYSIKFYLYPATEISYLEVRANQLPYIDKQSHNFAFSGIDLISWPYDL